MRARSQSKNARAVRVLRRLATSSGVPSPRIKVEPPGQQPGSEVPGKPWPELERGPLVETAAKRGVHTAGVPEFCFRAVDLAMRPGEDPIHMACGALSVGQLHARVLRAAQLRGYPVGAFDRDGVKLVIRASVRDLDGFRRSYDATRSTHVSVYRVLRWGSQ